MLRLTALKNGNIDLSEFKEGAWTREEAKRYIVENGDFLLSRGSGSKNLVGRGGLVISPRVDVAFPDTIVRLRLDVNKIYPRYFSYVWESRIIRSQIESSVRTTAGIYKINQKHIKNFSVPVPPLEEQQEIVERLEEKLSNADLLISDIDNDIYKAEAIRQSILKKAFSGQLVLQNSNDEPASGLLAHIQAEKMATQKTVAKPKAGNGFGFKRGNKFKVST